jgi:predicted phage tail protein
MRRRIYLHGALKEIHEGPIEVVASTVAEAVKRVTMQLKGFRPTAKGGYRRIKVVGYDRLEDLFVEGGEEIHLIPQLNGGKAGGFFQILLGAALIGVGLLTSAAGFGLLGSMMMKVGVLLLIGGILQLLQVPQANSPTNKSHYLGSPQNTVEIGTPIPILYGRRKVGGQILSLTTETVAV